MNNEFKAYLINISSRLKLSVKTLIKWLICAIISGIIIGLVGTVFSMGLTYVTNLRNTYSLILLFLPLAGLIIVFTYRITGQEDNTGTNLVITAIQSDNEVPVRVAPVIIISTLLTHLCGGSSGREGAALQVGGSLGNFFGKLFHFDEKDTRIFIMCGMSACFSSLFGTPIAAAIFSMEVISVGVMYYAALVPCVIASLIAQHVSGFFIHPENLYSITDIPDLTPITGIKYIGISIIFAIVSILFCVCLHASNKAYKKVFTNPYLRIAVAGLLVIGLRYLVNSNDYLGAGAPIIEQSFVNSCAWYVFILKIIFTAITLGGGFKGGEIVPALFIGATLGSFLGPVFGLPVALTAACGMVSIFCGVTNCPITSLIMAIEMFGSSSMKYCILCISLSYLLSGYYSLYNSQKIIYSKYKTTFINRKSI